jgi:UDP-N-acetyl-D-galactosamine dehydrogenase
VYPGLTEEVCIPIIEKITKLKRNQDFYYGYSPERINPGDKKHQLTSIKKIISGSNISTLKKIKYIYGKIIKAGIFSAKSVKIAEAAKVIENIQRDINVAFINELQIIFDKMGLDIHDVLKAANTKWNFLNFKPGLVGGHCIGIDPYYLIHKSKNIGYKPIIINSGRKINDKMANYYARKIYNTLKKNKELKKSRIKILIMGFTFKENCSDIRNSKVEDIYKFFKKKNLDVEIYDPWVNQKLEYYKFVKLPCKKKYDAIVITVKHDVFKKLGIKKIKSYGKDSSLIFDLKKIFNEK